MGREGGCSLCRIINLLVGMAFLGAGGYMIWYFLGKPNAEEFQGYVSEGFGDFSDVLKNVSGIDFGDMYNKDPFLSDNTTSSWPTTGEGGLSLEILNALDDTWQDEFTEAISDWENGSPDALTLSVTKGDVDYTCTPVDGLQKVCNGNYGETGWLGINEITKLTSSGEILTSVAKMNEYYLLNADHPKRQYTMCHEVGHGFGLPHTDEAFDNPSLGNCLDYTNWPEDNMHPDVTNYNRLVSLYGTVGGRRMGSDSGTVPLAERPRILSEELRTEYEEAIAEIEQLQVRRSLEDGSAVSQWELVEYHAGGSRYTRFLGDDYSIDVHLLHTIP